jgi:hypothetical protein
LMWPPMVGEGTIAVPADGPTNRDIRAYLAYIKDQKGKGVPRGPAARLVRRVSSPGLRDAAKLYGTTLLAPITSRRARAIAAGRTDLRLLSAQARTGCPGG